MAKFPRLNAIYQNCSCLFMYVLAENNNVIIKFLWKCKGSGAAKSKSKDSHFLISKLIAKYSNKHWQ